MISKIGQSTYRPSFAGDRDIVLIDDHDYALKGQKTKIELALGNKKGQYKIHEALGGDEGIKKVKDCKPALVVTAYNMPLYMGPSRENLIKKLKILNTKVIVNTNNWSDLKGDAETKAGVKKCEDECGADKFVTQYDSAALKNSVNAILDGKKIPRYPFQKK